MVAENKTFTSTVRLPDLPPWERPDQKRVPWSFDLELTPRCNNGCRHCYINVPANDPRARQTELNLEEIGRIAEQAVRLGALWVLLTGGEPLLRKDFVEIYLILKRKGLLVSLFTNACLVTEEHVRLFQQYPPRDIEVSVYGATQETYEAVTRRPGSYAAFRRGLDLLLEGGVKVRLKAMVLRSNLHEFTEISDFCRRYTKDSYRFDPLLHLRYDGDELRNADIRSERLTPHEIAALDQADPERSAALKKECGLATAGGSHANCDHIFHCGAGEDSFSVSYDGYFRLCSSLVARENAYDLRAGSLSEAWHVWVPRVRDLRSDSRDYHDHCLTCPLINLCLWCPANGYLESGRMDGRSEYFCQVARARAGAIRPLIPPQDGE